MFRANSGSNPYAPHLPGIGVNAYATDAYFPFLTLCNSKFLLIDVFGFAELHVKGALKLVQITILYLVAKRVYYLLSIPISESAILVKGFYGSSVLASLMSAKHQQTRRQNMK